MQRLNLSLDRPQLLTTTEEALQACAYFRERGAVAVDTETTGLDIIRDVPLFVGLSDKVRRVAVQVNTPACDALQELLGDERVVKILFNAKFDAHMLANRGMKLAGPWHDVMVQAAMTESSRSSNQLKDLMVIVYGVDDPRSLQYADFSGTFGKVTKKKTAKELLESAPIEKVLQYVTCDAWGTFQLYETLSAQLRHARTWRGQELWRLFHDIEVPYTKVLWDLERTGIRVNPEHLEKLGAAWDIELQDIERKFAQEVGRSINIRSGDQLRDYFILEKGLVTPRKTKGGESGEVKSSIDKVTLDIWANQGIEAAALVKRHRELGVLRSHFIKPLISLRDNRDRVHTTFTQMVRTGRLASDSPNLQNIPVRSEDGKKIRYAFIASEGMVLLDRDYDQLEMKLAAALSGDKNMIAIINAGKDIHAGNAAIAFEDDGAVYELIMEGVRLKDAELPVPPELKAQLKFRTDAKTIGFGTLYGEGDYKLSVQLKCDLKKAKATRVKFFTPFPQLLAFIRETHAEAIREKSVQTITGRFRTLPAAAMLNTPAHFEALRQAFNTKIQGSAADVTKLAMIRTHGDRRLAGLGARMLLQIHDELIVEHPPEAADEVNRIVGEHMENCLESEGLRLPVKLTSSGRSASSWGAAH